MKIEPELIKKTTRKKQREWFGGQKYGQVRDEVNKRHPCLVPYCDLSESEKDYDRHTAISTLKFICKMGFRISN